MLSGKHYRFRPRAEVLDARYLELYLLSPKAQALLDAMKTGISDSGLNLTRNRFLALPVPAPGLDEQRHIVEILEDLLSRMDAAGQTLSGSQARVEGWYRSAIDRVVWTPRNLATLVPVGDLLRERMRNGHSARASRTGEGVRTLTITAVTRNSFIDEFTKISAAEESRVRDLWLEDGDILVQRSNTSELVGTTAIYHGPDRWAIFPDLLIRLRADESRVMPDYLAAVMRTERAHRFLRGRARGLAGSMPKIDQAAIGSLEVPLISLGEQASVVRSVLGVEDARGELDRGIAIAEQKGNALISALLEAAFTGDLTAARADVSGLEAVRV